MYKHKLEVWGEDLAVADLSSSSNTALPVFAGGTNGGLCVHVIADTAITSAAVSSATPAITITGATSKTGSYSTTVATYSIPAGSYAKGDLITTIALPVDCPAWIKAAVVGNASSSGTATVTLGYLAR